MHRTCRRNRSTIGKAPSRWVSPSGCRSALEGIRTPNLLIRSQMLYPLSYERIGRLPAYQSMTDRFKNSNQQTVKLTTLKAGWTPPSPTPPNTAETLQIKPHESAGPPSRNPTKHRPKPHKIKRRRAPVLNARRLSKETQNPLNNQAEDWDS